MNAEEAVKKFRSVLAERVEGIAMDAAIQKAHDVVDDDVCDSLCWGAQKIANAFNELAGAVGCEPIDVPDDLDPSPYQEDEEDKEDEEE